MHRKSESFLAQRKQNKDKLQYGYQSTYLILLGAIAFLLIYYVIALNTSATQGFTIRELHNTQTQLKIELDRLNVQIAEIQSSDSISSDQQLQEIMEEYEDPNYVVIKQGVQYVYNN